jgi:arabinogalactan endo-1,4-beta-galactosidase
MEIPMKTVLAILLLSASSFALAHNCPNEMKAIDAKLSSAKGISAEDMSKIKSLRADGEKFHKAGKHDESMKALQQAKSMLNL